VVRLGLAFSGGRVPALEAVERTAVAGCGADAIQWFQGLAAGVPDVGTCRRIRRACAAHGIAVPRRRLRQPARPAA
jgi:hypothetical protein